MAPMHKDRWRAELDAATGEKDVVNVARDFIAFLSRAELATLRREVRPGPIDNGDDVAMWAVTLVREQFAVGLAKESIAVIDALSEFLSAAAAKIAHLRARAPVEDSEERRGSGT
jgi:hypothetical protein